MRKRGCEGGLAGGMKEGGELGDGAWNRGKEVRETEGTDAGVVWLCTCTPPFFYFFSF